MNRFHSRIALALCSALFAGAATAATVQPNKTAQPVNFVANYEVSAAIDARRAKEHPELAGFVEKLVGLFGGSIPVGSVSDTVSIAPTSYRVNSSGKAATVISAVLPGDTLKRSSEGTAGGGYLSSRRFTETRGKGEPRLVTLDYAGKVAAYYKGGKMTKREAIRYRTADIAALPYLFYRQPLPRAATTVAATDGISTRLMTFVPAADTVKLGAETIPALRLTRRPAQKDDPMIEIWVRSSDGFPLRIRIDLNSRYGAVFDQRLTALPALPR